MKKTKGFMSDFGEQDAIDASLGDEHGLIGRLVAYTHRLYGGTTHDMEDRRQIARMAYLKACKIYDASRNVPFDRYAKYVIGQSLFEVIRTQTRRSRIAKMYTFTDANIHGSRETDGGNRHEEIITKERMSAERQYALTAKPRSELASLLSDLSDDARTIIDLIISGPLELKPGPLPVKRIQQWLVVELLNQKWKWERIQKTITEIKTSIA